jgi:drug/metabolite transporter (DMT)-like permease
VTALLFALTSPFSLVLGYLVLGERIDLRQGLGVILILAGILVAIAVRRRRPAPMIPLSDGEPIEAPAPEPMHLSAVGIALGVITALGQAFGTLFARPAMASGIEPFAAMAVRAGVGLICFWALLLVPAVRRRKSTFRMADLGLATASAFFGTGLGMSLLLGALKAGDVGIVSTLASMTPIVILPMVWLRSGRMPHGLAWGGAGLAIIGTALIGLG